MKKTGKRLMSLALAAFLVVSHTEQFVWAAESEVQEADVEPTLLTQEEETGKEKETTESEQTEEPGETPETKEPEQTEETDQTEEKPGETEQLPQTEKPEQTEVTEQTTEPEQAEVTEQTTEPEQTETTESEKTEIQETEQTEAVDSVEPRSTEITVANPDEMQKKYEFTWNGAGYTEVKLGVWSEKNGQDDLIWYPASRNGDTCKANVEVKNHASTGVYIAHAYGKNKDGASEYIAGARFTVDPPTTGKAVTEEIENGFRVKLAEVSSPSGIQKVEAAVWCRDDQSDLVWEDTEEKDGNYVIDVDAIRHGIPAGKYKVHFYAIDGNGFRNYCGGITYETTLEDNILTLQNKDQQQKVYSLTLSTTEYTNVKFAVWSEKDGQNDLKWYTGKKEGNTYRADFAIKNHGSTGLYYVHAYGEKGGKTGFIKGVKFTVDPPTEGKFSVTPTDTGFRVKFDGISSPAGITKVEAAVWCSSDQSDLIWHTLTPKDGTYELDVKTADHKKLLGEYVVHVYAEDGNGIRTYCGGIRQKVAVTADSMNADLSGNTCDIVVSGVRSYGTDCRIRIAVWSDKNGQDDLVWYDTGKDGTTYSVSIPSEKIKDEGNYYAHAYAVDGAGKKSFVKGITFSKVNVVTIGEAAKGQLVIDISNVDGEKEFSGFSAEVWTKEDKSDLLEVNSAKVSDQQHTIIIPLSKFGLFSGDYRIAVYGIKSDGTRKLLREETKKILLNKGTIVPPATSDQVTYTVTLKDMDLKGMEKEIEFAVWSDVDGQDDLQWYTPKKSGNSYTVEIPISAHKGTGKYFVHIYATLQDDSSVFVNGTTFQVEEIKQSSLEIRNIDGKKGTAQIAEKLGNLGYTVTGVRVGVWNADTDGEVVWYDMSQVSGEYVATFDIRNHNQQFGKYNAHVYVADESEEYKYMDGASFTISPSNRVVYEKTDGANGKVIIYGPNVDGKAVTSIKMATWSTAGDQDDLKWIEAKMDSNGGYYVNIVREDYKRSGEFTTHVYGYIDGESYCLGGINYTVYNTGEFDEYAQEVMHKIIFAVETGGQVYGKAQYDCFSEAYHLSEKETAITIGAAGWFATEAQKLLRLTREEDPELFASLDTEGISQDVDQEDWTTYGGDGNGKATILKGSPKAKCIQALISSEAGIRVQNRLVDQQMVKYVNEAKSLGVEDLKGQMFLANVRHLGGYGPMEWVVECCEEDQLPLTMRNLYTSMRNHTSNKGGNGVGADKYNSRHVKVMDWLDQYIV